MDERCYAKVAVETHSLRERRRPLQAERASPILLQQCLERYVIVFIMKDWEKGMYVPPVDIVP